MGSGAWVTVVCGSDGTLTLVFGPWFLLSVAAILLVCGATYMFRRRGRWGAWEVVEANIRLGNIGDVKVSRNAEVVQIAHRARVELITRKAALPIDPANDVIVEVYDSWYQLFREMRQLARECPARLYWRDESVRRTVDLLVAAMNDGLRPHLTRWQARFRAWYGEALRRDPGRAPQDIQREFPEYDELMSDLQAVNGELVAYAEFLGKVVTGGSRN